LRDKIEWNATASEYFEERKPELAVDGSLDANESNRLHFEATRFANNWFQVDFGRKYAVMALEFAFPFYNVRNK